MNLSLHLTFNLPYLGEVTFVQPYWQLGLIACLVYFTVGLIQRSQRFLPLVIRTVVCALLFVALSEPAVRETRSERSLSLLMDLSQSIPANVADSYRNLLEPFLNSRQAFRANEDSRIKAFFFGREMASVEKELRTPDDLEQLSSILQNQNSLVDSGATNIASALEHVASRSSAGNLLLLSDGQETDGDAGLAADLLKARGVRVFPITADEEFFLEHQLSLSHLDAPLTIAAGKIGEIHTAIRNSNKSGEERGVLEIWLEQKKLFSQQISVPAGEERLITVKTPAMEGGLHRIRTLLKHADSPPQELHRWVAAKEKSRLLLLSGSNEDRRVLKQLYALKGYTLEDIVADGKSAIPTKFENFSGIVINNVSAPQLPKAFLPALKTHVESGGGLLIVGGDRSFGLGQFIGTPLEEISPLKFVPPRTTQRRLNSAVILVIDKSRSMLEDNKIESAKRAALLSVNSLKNDDLIGVIGFDSAPFVIIRLAPVPEVQPVAERRLRNLTAAGRTNLLPALAAARQSLAGAKASRKHIIVLSDGQVPDAGGEYVSEAARLASNGITLSTIALGAEADVPFMQTLAKRGNGAFYHTLDPTRLPEIFVHDIKVTTGEKTMKERNDFPIVTGPSGIRSTTVASFPNLRGYVETIPKPNAYIELVTHGEDSKPLLASWSYGAGKVVAFTSDANGRWSLPWLNWEGFSRFWGDLAEQIQRGTAKKTPDVDFDLRYRISRDDIELDLTIFDPQLATRGGPPVTAEVIFPGGEARTVSFAAENPGRFLSLLKHARPGDYRIKIKYGSAELPAVGITLDKNQFGERFGSGIRYDLLSEIARRSGGKINPSPEDLTQASEEIESFHTLVPPILILAFFLAIPGIFFREWLQSR